MEDIQAIPIIKASGEEAIFDPNKLITSLQRSGANDALIKEILEEVELILEPGISTQQIYKKAFSLLKRQSERSAGKYRLKKAILELGPSGYPFEKFVAEIFKSQDYETVVGREVKGHCVYHELDIIAEKGDHHIMVECKFHSNFNRHCDVKVPLYIQSRFKDVQEGAEAGKYQEVWIVTNTRFTSDAVAYGRCMQMNLVSWDYPKHGSLKERIDLAGLHPISCLSGLNRKEKEILLERGTVLCRNLGENPHLLDVLGISYRKKQKVLNEAAAICSIPE